MMLQRRLLSEKKDPLGVTVVCFDAIFLGLAAVALGIRITSRFIQGHRLCFNDYAVLLAWPFAACLVTTAVLAVAEGAGQHVTQVNPANLPKLLKGYVAADIAWALSNTAIKISILHFYITLFGLNKAFRFIASAIMGLALCFGLGVILQALLTCRPLAKTWDPLLPGTCGSSVGAILATSICNFIVDVLIITLPMPMVWRLQMATQRKIGLTIIFSLGFLTCIVTIFRISLAARLSVDDFSFDLARLAIVTDLEPLLGITVACSPLFPPALNKLFRRKNLPTSQNVLSSSLARLRSKETKKSAFRKFDDSLPLTDIGGTRTENHISSPGSRPDSTHNDLIEHGDSDVLSSSRIQVKHGWEIRSDKSQ